MSPAQGHITAAPRLTSHLRALSLIAPIQKLEDTKGLLHTQGQSAEHVDLRYLALAAIELLIERMGAGGTASRADLLDYLASLATIQWDSISPDDAATLAEHVFDGLTNARDRRARFKVRLFDPERPGGAPLEFGLLRAEALPDGKVGYRLTQEAIEVHLSLLDHDPLTATQVSEIIVEEFLRRGLAADNKLKLRGPVVVSEASLEASAVITDAAVVFGPFSAARVNKQAAAEEKARLAAALEGKERELAEALTQLGHLEALIDNLRELHGAFDEERPDALQRRSRVLQSDAESATREAQQAAERQRAITGERAKIRSRLSDTNATISRLKSWVQHVEQFAKRYPDIASAVARIPVAASEQRSEEQAASVAEAAAGQAREDAATRRADAATLRERAHSRRSEKLHYPETDGGAPDRTGILEDLSAQYRTAEQILNSKRDAATGKGLCASRYREDQCRPTHNRGRHGIRGIGGHRSPAVRGYCRS